MTVVKLDLDEVLAALERAGCKPRRMPGGYWKATCPAHDDEKPSLSVLEGEDGYAILKCHAGCDTGQILRALGLDGRPAPRTKKTPRGDYREVVYEIRDISGNLVAKHIRRDYPNGTKSFFWAKPDGSLGLDCKVEDLPLFGSELIPTFDTEKPVVITEGEKAALALRHRGFQALATVTGASVIPSAKVLAELDLKRFGRIVLWPDSDPPGFLHMRRLAARLLALGVRAHMVRPPQGTPPGWDAADITDADLAARLIAEAIPYDGPAERLPFGILTASALIADATIQPPQALIPGLIPCGFTIIGGRPKVGKTYLALQLGLGLASGGLVLGRIAANGQRSVLYLALEDGPARIKSRLQQLAEVAAPSDRLAFVFDIVQEELLAFLSEWAQAHPGGVIVVDTLARVLPRPKAQRNAYEESYANLTTLSDLTRAYNVNLIGIHHLRKGNPDPDNTDITAELAGGTGYAAVPDGILILRPDAGFTRLDVVCRDWPRASYGLNFDSGHWVFLGSLEDVKTTQYQRQIIELIEACGGKVTPGELAKALGVGRGTAGNILSRLARRGVLRHTPDGSYSLASPPAEGGDT